ncbi:MAG: hypothetical protein DMF92_07950 [Acidobacteria bacterium]|nr:MAG: hypothetical protein DMF92_07950 [Acidobacteriota bacterium]
MPKQVAIRLYAFAGLTAALLLLASPASAQFVPRPLNDPATGETYHIEGGVGFWFPGAQMVVSSESLGIVGTPAEQLIDLKSDLGLTDQHFSELHLVLRPSNTSKFRLQYIPINYTQSAVIRRTIVFNGQRYSVGLPVNSSLSWKAYRFGYEYDFVQTNRGYAGFLVEAKYTDVQVQLDSPITSEFARAQAPIPALGGIGRVYVVPNISITVDISGFKLPEKLIKGSTGHYIDVDVYGTINFTNNFGAQLGYRSFDVGYVVTHDTGSFKLKGLYLGAVARY